MLLFFSLGHRFVPHRTKVSAKNFHDELEETRRKLAWKIYFEGRQAKSNTKYVHYKKGSWPAEVYTKQLDGEINAAKVNYNEITLAYKNAQPVQSHYTHHYWRRAFMSMVKGSRFMQCDKNLGVRIVDEKYYSRLAHRESRCYRYSDKIDITEECMNENVLRFKLVSAAIVNASTMVSKSDSAVRQVLLEISEYMHFSVSNDRTFQFPKLRMLLKVHKPVKADGLLGVRPIIPNYGLPSYSIAKWLGAFMAKMVKCIPWALESTEQFLNFIKNPIRSQNVATFDFSNLYGNEPVAETLSLFFSALHEMPWTFNDPSDVIVFKALMNTVHIPEEICFREVLRSSTGETNVFMLLLAECIFCTVAELDLGCGEKVLVSTADFLAMGCPPVAPLSIIALAYLEHTLLGAERCSRGLRRLIDDIIIDTDVISETELRAIYPKYLELNYGDQGHFLDVTYAWWGERFVTFPYIKPFMTIPLNANSCHPWHMLRASVKNELVRLLGLCSESTFEEPWIRYWRERFLAAGYGGCLLDRIESEVRHPIKRVRIKKVRVVNHVETWIGTDSKTAATLTKSTQRDVSQTWKVQPSLLSMALKAHEWKGDSNKNNLSKYVSSFSR